MQSPMRQSSTEPGAPGGYPTGYAGHEYAGNAYAGPEYAGSEYAGHAHPGQPYAGPHYSAAPVARKRRGSAVPWIVGGCGGLLLAGIIAVVLIISSIVGIVRSFPDRPEREPRETFAAEPASAQRIDWRERPLADEWLALITRLHDDYVPLIRSGEIYDLLPDGRAVGADYVEAFRLTVVDMSLAIGMGWSIDSTSAAEVDDHLHGYIERFTELERQFLAGEDLDGVHITFVLSDGTVKVYDGDNPANDTRPEPVPERVADPYAYVREYPYRTDADGTYITAGEEIAAAFGMTVVYSFGLLEEACPYGISGEWYGAFCPNTPMTVYIPGDSNDGYPAQYSEPGYLDIVRHEIAHMLVFEQCGSAVPPVSGARHEAMTNSYAVLYLGASRDLLQPLDSSSEYWMDEESDRMAEAVHSGRCS